jgi:hypothetical protein
MIAPYSCTNPDCDHVTSVTIWLATRTDPQDSTWGDGCEECGADLCEEPEDLYDPDAERDWDMEMEMQRGYD